jgi:inhibitor of KinA
MHTADASAPSYRWISDRHLAVSWHDDDARRITSCWEHLRSTIPAIDVIPSHRSVTVQFDPANLDQVRALAQVKAAVESLSTINAPLQKLHELPTCYDGPCAPDLADLALHASRSVEEVIRLHTHATFTVRYIGFAPGFPYLTGLPAALHMRRLDRPRQSVPAGSVAIAGDQAGIYPSQSPGGWRIIGQTPVKLFDLTRASPCLFAPGDHVRFVRISRDEFNALAASKATPS